MTGRDATILYLLHRQHGVRRRQRAAGEINVHTPAARTLKVVTGRSDA